MSIIDTAKDLGQGIYDKSEIDASLSTKADINGSNTRSFKVAEATTSDEASTKGYIDNKPTGFKNLIINGGFDVWQRGTSYSYVTNNHGYYTADRIYSSSSTDGQFTFSKVVTAGRNSLKINVDTANTDLTGNKLWHGIRYTFEGQDLYTPAHLKKTVTLSFIFNSNVVGKYPISLRNLTDGANGVNSYVTTFDYVKANTAQKIEVQIPLDYTFNPAVANNNATGLSIAIAFLNEGDYVTSTTEAWVDTNSLTTTGCVNWGATAGNFVAIAELQLEEGSIATPFENRPYGLELSLCQRYYKEDSFVCTRVSDLNTFAGQSVQSISFTLMRTIPSLTFILTNDTSSKGQDITTLSKILGTDLCPHNDKLSDAGQYTEHLVKMDAEL